MTEAGHSAGTYRIVFQLPPALLPRPDQMAFGEDMSRQLDGGCGLYNADLNYSRETLLPVFEEIMSAGVNDYAEANPEADVKMIDPSRAFEGHELCSKNAPRDQANDTGEGIPPLGDHWQERRMGSLDFAARSGTGQLR